VTIPAALKIKIKIKKRKVKEAKKGEKGRQKDGPGH